MRGDRYYLGEIRGGKLYYRSTAGHTTLANALAAELAEGYRSGHLIILNRPAKSHGKVYGTSVSYFSALDGEPIPTRSVEGLLR